MRNRHAKRMKQRRRSKCYAELVHFQNRCLQRVGVILSQSKLKEKLFKTQDGVFFAKQSLSKSKWLYKHIDGKEYVLVYDKNRKRFVTIMPREWEDSGQPIVNQ